jgi:hypothetical protein
MSLADPAPGANSTPPGAERFPRRGGWDFPGEPSPRNQRDNPPRSRQTLDVGQIYLSHFSSIGRPAPLGGLFFPQRPDASHRERRIASIIITALAAAKIPTNKKCPSANASPQPKAASIASATSSQCGGIHRSLILTRWPSRCGRPKFYHFISQVVLCGMSIAVYPPGPASAGIVIQANGSLPVMPLYLPVPPVMM